MNHERSTMNALVNMDAVIANVLVRLKKRGYRMKFRRDTDCLFCFELQTWIAPENFIIDRYYFFEDVLNPDSERMLYAISLANGSKGFLIETCNVYLDNISSEMIQKLKLNKTRRRREDLLDARKQKRIFRKVNEALTF